MQYQHDPDQNYLAPKGGRLGFAAASLGPTMKKSGIKRTFSGLSAPFSFYKTGLSPDRHDSETKQEKV